MTRVRSWVIVDSCDLTPLRCVPRALRGTPRAVGLVATVPLAFAHRCRRSCCHLSTARSFGDRKLPDGQREVSADHVTKQQRLLLRRPPIHLPCHPRTNSRIVAGFVSRMHSMISLPLPSITATEIVALVNVHANILFWVHNGAPFGKCDANNHNLP